jgi:hypothetical protein
VKTIPIVFWTGRTWSLQTLTIWIAEYYKQKPIFCTSTGLNVLFSLVWNCPVTTQEQVWTEFQLFLPTRQFWYENVDLGVILTSSKWQKSSFMCETCRIFTNKLTYGFHNKLPVVYTSAVEEGEPLTKPQMYVVQTWYCWFIMRFFIIHVYSYDYLT